MDGGFREWLAGLSRRELAVMGLLGAALVTGAALWYLRSLPGPVEIRSAQAGPAAGPSPTPPPVFVHVAGWVKAPGVYELRQGDRVIDAVRAAGGAKRGAVLDALNLAAVLADGQQVLVPRKGHAEPGAAAPVGEGVPQKVNLNTAGLEELDTLPGIGEVLAQRIIDHREEHGGFASVDDLIDVSGIGEKTLADLRDLVTV